MLPTPISQGRWFKGRHGFLHEGREILAIANFFVETGKRDLVPVDGACLRPVEQSWPHVFVHCVMAALPLADGVARGFNPSIEGGLLEQNKCCEKASSCRSHLLASFRSSPFLPSFLLNMKVGDCFPLDPIRRAQPPSDSAIKLVVQGVRLMSTFTCSSWVNEAGRGSLEEGHVGMGEGHA